MLEFGDAALTAADWGYVKPRELMFLLASSPTRAGDLVGFYVDPAGTTRGMFALPQD